MTSHSLCLWSNATGSTYDYKNTTALNRCEKPNNFHHNTKQIAGIQNRVVRLASAMQNTQESAKKFI